MKYISNRVVNAERNEAEGGYKLTAGGKSCIISESAFEVLFKPCDSEKESLRREYEFVSRNLEELLENVHSSKFKKNYPIAILRHLMRSQSDFMAEYLHLLRKRMRLTTEYEKARVTAEEQNELKCLLKRVSNRAKLFLHMSKDNLPKSHFFTFYAEQDGERKNVLSKWIVYTSDTMTEVENICKELYVDGFRSIEVEHNMEYEEGNPKTLRKVYGYQAKIK